MNVLMTGVDQRTRGGMWTVAQGYLQDPGFCRDAGLTYIPTATSGSVVRRLAFSAAAFARIFFALLTGRYDVVHVHMSERGSVYRKHIVCALGRLFGCRIVIHMHGAEFSSWYEGSGDRTRRFVRGVLNRADRILLLGEYCRPQLAALIDDPKKLRILYNAVSVPDENPYSAEAKDLLFLGVAGRRKGIEDLLDAMQKIDAGLDEDVRLMIYGPASDVDVDGGIKSRGLSRRVFYKGWLDQAQRASVFARTAVNILPSYHEGLPMTILETMAHGIPNISTAVDGIPEAVTSENGVLIQPGDADALAGAILSLVSDPDVRMQKSRAAHQAAAQRFSLRHHVDQLLGIYRELCAAPKP